MTQSELPLYPKISSIYNKILQLGIAIMLIVVLMNITIDSYGKNQRIVTEHFDRYSNHYLHQAAMTTRLLMTTGKKSQINDHIEQLSEPDFIKSVFLYDETGQLISQSGDNVNVNELYGVGGHSDNQSQVYRPFVSEIRGKKLHGYLRITIEKQPLIKQLSVANQNNQELGRVMLIMAGCVGFFLTRGLSRFSRQGYRVKGTNQKAK